MFPTPTRFFLAILVTLACALGPAVAVASGIPAGWRSAGSMPGDYLMGDEDGAGFLEGAREAPRGFGTLMQRFDAELYRGQRLRLSADVRSHEVTGWAGLWLRVDGCQGSSVLAFDNMEDRPIQGTTGWTRYEIVLDVPEAAQAIAFGILLEGSGRIDFDDFRFETVDEAPVTGQRTLAAAPSNLDFGGLGSAATD